MPTCATGHRGLGRSSSYKSSQEQLSVAVEEDANPVWAIELEDDRCKEWCRVAAR